MRLAPALRVFFAGLPMTTCRILIATCLALLLTACGEEHKDKAPAASPAPVPSSSAPATPPAQPPKAAAEHPRESEAAPAAAAAVAADSAPAVEKAAKPEPKAEAKAPAKPQPKAGHKEKPNHQGALDPAIKKPLPHVQLDLRLPRDLVHQLQPERPVSELEDKPLLPPMFAEKNEESPFQVGGRLIQREHNEREPSDDSWHSDIRGAELQFQFRN